MGFYDNDENIQKYIAMCDSYDGSKLYQFLSNYVPEACTLLELGSGPGNDVVYLHNHYQYTGSDASQAFLKYLHHHFLGLKFLQVDAINLSLVKSYDCLYSNKVLHHLSKSELQRSLQLQKTHLNDKGLIAHSFWLGEGREELEGLLFQYHNESELLHMISLDFEIVSTLKYGEFADGDSMLVIARKAGRRPSSIHDMSELGD